VIAAALIAALAWYPICAAFDSDAQRISDFADSLASLGGVFGGFLLTAATLLAAVMDRRLIKRLRETGHLDYLLLETLMGIVVFLALALTASLARLVDGTPMLALSVLSVFMAALGAHVLLQAGSKYLQLIRLM
jgi:hypothetical protein